MPHIAILGGGSFGTALANIAADNGNAVFQWLRDEEMVNKINSLHVNDKYLPGISLNESIKATRDIAEAVKGAEIIFLAVPSAACSAVCQQLKAYLSAKTMVVSCTKGISKQGFRLMSEVVEAELGDLASVGVLSGPNLAKEIAQRQLTATVVACADERLVESVQACLNTSYFRVYGSSDKFGVELAGALKNIYAIASGMASELGFGENTRSMLLTRALAEMCRLAYTLGADPMTFLGLAGVGDLVATCQSDKSRNFRVGVALGKGLSVEQAVADMDQVAEGVNTILVVREKGLELDVYMPIVEGLYQIVYQQQSVKAVLAQLMSAAQSVDVEFIAKMK